MKPKKNLSRYSELLISLRERGYLSDNDVAVLLNDSGRRGEIYLNNIETNKADIVRRAIFEQNMTS